MFESIGEKRGLKFSYIDTSDIDLVRKNIRKETKALYIETPSNPTMRITDFAEMRKLADEFGLLILADNTFLSPYFQKPLQLGADIVVHSGTKFLGGHNDVLAGFVCVKGKELSEKLRYTYKTVGCSLSPFDSFLVLRGIKTLSVRLERQQENAKKISKLIRDEGPKGVKAQIQGDELRVSSKSRDALQQVQKMVKDADYEFAVQFVNYR